MEKSSQFATGQATRQQTCTQSGVNGRTASMTEYNKPYTPLPDWPFTDRDLNSSPFSEDELRVVKYLEEIAPDFGAGNDPILFLISSHGSLRHVNKMLTMEVERLRDENDRLKKLGGK